MDAVRNYFPNRKEDLPPPLLSLMDVFITTSIVCKRLIPF